MAWITMINSVGELEAGKKVQVAQDVADRYILCGYAEGDLSQEYTDEEKASIRAGTQEVNL